MKFSIIKICFLIFISSLFFNLTWAETNGVWVFSEDIRGGTFGEDEQDTTSFFKYINPVYFMNGNIGIGTDDPRYDLHIKNPTASYASNFGGLGFVPSNGANYNQIYGYNGQGLRIGGSSRGTTFDLNEIFLNDTGMFFATSTNNGASVIDRFVILNNGQIGIGKTNLIADAKLDVAGNIYMNGELVATGSSVATSLSDYYTKTQSDARYVIRDEANTIKTNMIVDNAITTSKIINNAITTSKITNDAVTDAKVSPYISINNGRLYAPVGNGNVGIGNTNPSQKLDVNGKIRMRTQTSSADSADTVVTKGFLENEISSISISTDLVRHGSEEVVYSTTSQERSAVSLCPSGYVPVGCEWKNLNADPPHTAWLNNVEIVQDNLADGLDGAKFHSGVCELVGNGYRMWTAGWPGGEIHVRSICVLDSNPLN